MAEASDTTEIPLSEKKLNPRQLQFAHLVGTGTTQREAYRQVYGKHNDGNAYRAAQRPNVAAAIASYQREAAGTSVIKRDEVLRILTAIIRTPVGHLDASNPITAEYSVTRKGDAEITRIKALPKLEALKLLCQLCGWLKPQENEEPLTIILKKMW